MWKTLVPSLVASLAFSQAYAVPQVKLGRTTVTGRDVTENVEFFGGIPFAEPPLGPLRFSKTVLKTHLDVPTFNASSFGNGCLQPRLDPSTISEDCLTINVFRPAGVSYSEKLPVLFWTYGGAFVSGSSSIWDGSKLVARSVERGTPMVYVNFNYRLGPLGFPQGQEADDRRALNLGIHDQTAALEWVQENIHFFGGDKGKVTIAGLSAGSVLCAVQYLNPHIERLARAAILQSGQANGLGANPAARNEDLWQKFVGDVASCANVSTSGDVFECLKSAPTEEILSAVAISNENTDFPWKPTLDVGEGSVYPDYPSRLYAKGQFARIPFIAGSTLDEGTVFAQAYEVTHPDLRAWIVEQHSPPTVSSEALEEVTDKLLELYPDDPTVGSPFGTGEELFGYPSSYKRRSALMGDMWFGGNRRHWSQAATQFGVKNYGYHFTQPQGPAEPWFGVSHGADRTYIYGDVPSSNPVGQALSTTMMDYWISFVVSLDPNDGKGVQRPVWPQYTETDPLLMQLDGTNLTTAPDEFRKEQITFLNENALVLGR